MWAPEFPEKSAKAPRKIRERAAKDAMVPFPIYCPFLLLRWADKVCEEMVGRHIANVCQCQT